MKSTSGFRKLSLAVAPPLLLVCVGALCVWGTVFTAGRELRTELLNQAHLVAPTINLARIQTLSGTPADEEGVDYLRLKRLLADIQTANPQFRFISLLGRKPDGTIFFYVDSEPADSEHLSRPGQIYEEARLALRRAFEERVSAVEGPAPDRWGDWVTALVPLIEPSSGQVVAVLSMDVDVRNWRMQVAARAALPAGLILVLLAGMGTVWAAVKRVDVSAKPVLRRLLPSLATILVLPIIGAGALLWHQYRHQMLVEALADVSELADGLSASLKHQSSSLAGTAQVIAADAPTQAALRQGDSARLESIWSPVLKILARDSRVANLLFINTDRVCIARVHEPTVHGDRIDRFTILQAERTRRAAAGLDLNTQGEPLLRVAQPIFEDGALVGYVELSKKIEETLEALHMRPEIQLAVVIRKDLLDRAAWEQGMRQLGREVKWERIARSAVVYASQDRLPDPFSEWVDRIQDGRARKELPQEINVDGSMWQASAIPLRDASGRELGDAIVLRNIETETRTFARLIAVSVAVSAVVLALVLGFIYVLLRRADAGIRAQQEALRESEESYRNQFMENSAFMLLIDPDDGSIVDANVAALNFYGYSRERITAMNIRDINTLPYPEIMEAMASLRDKNGQRFDFQHRLADGSVREMEVGVTRIRFGGRTLLHSIGQDVTERKEAERALLQEQKFIEALLASLPGIFYLYTYPEGKLVRWNKNHETLLGYEEGEIKDRHIMSWHPPEAWETLRQAVDKVMESGQAAIESPLLTKDGRQIPFLITGMRFELQGKTYLMGVGIDIAERKRAEDTLRDSQAMLKSIFRSAPVGIGVVTNRMLGWTNERLSAMTGYAPEELKGQSARLFYPSDEEFQRVGRVKYERIAEHGTGSVETRWRHKDGHILDVLLSSTPIDPNDLSQGVTFTALDISERKRAEEMIKKRIVALTRPMEGGAIAFEDLFAIEEIQRIQDEFALATGVASMITYPDGTPITMPSNFTHLCGGIIRKTERGCENCIKSDAAVERYYENGPVSQRCLSGGLWDAGVSIVVGDRHIANWLIGQVRDESQTEEDMRAYAREIGADEDALVKAFYDVPVMSRPQFEQIARALYTLSNQLSTTAYQNIQQARFITERTKAEDALRASEERYRELVENANSIIIRLDSQGKVTFINEFAQRYFGFAEDEIVGRHVVGTIVPEDDASGQLVHEVIRDIGVQPEDKRLVENENMLRDGTRVWISWTNRPIFDENGQLREILCVGIDATARKRAEEDKAKLEGQLLQAQKMESVGRLAGGVAHDFNNMLGVILGYTELALEELDPTHPLHADLTEVRRAAERSADLTRQLLAFARKQTVSPKVLDLNEAVSSTLKMLERLIGEDIELLWIPGADVGQVRMDPSQIDQILANLCVNARDAIADVGKITIETENCILTEEYCADHVGFDPGEYARLSISDNGCGMSKETLSHLFEPFFTTKAVGKGTGLGLATVYGAVKQNNGYITAFSEPGRGTTFSIYLPRYKGKVEQAQTAPAEYQVGHGSATVLLVEDEPSILNICKTMLERLGLTVVSAVTPGEALRIAQTHPGDIDLLMTDVIMPEMNGRELAKNLLSLYPQVKRLFMSGYTADVIAHHGVLEEGVHFIQKPFTLERLSAKIREMLASE